LALISAAASALARGDPEREGPHQAADAEQDKQGGKRGHPGLYLKQLDLAHPAGAVQLVAIGEIGMAEGADGQRARRNERRAQPETCQSRCGTRSVAIAGARLA
jgi:hypothetical protein